MKNTAILQKVESLLQQMTLEEKIGQLNQTGTTMVSALPGIEADIARDGRWGRIVESPREDVYLACKIAETMIIW